MSRFNYIKNFIWNSLYILSICYYLVCTYYTKLFHLWWSLCIFVSPSVMPTSAKVILTPADQIPRLSSVCGYAPLLGPKEADMLSPRENSRLRPIRLLSECRVRATTLWLNLHKGSYTQRPKLPHSGL